MHHWTIKKQIILGLAILILINIVVGIFTSAGISKLKSFVQNISTSQLRGVYVLGQIQSKENEAYDLMLHHLLADTKDETENYNTRLTECSLDIDKLITSYEQASPDQRPREGDVRQSPRRPRRF